jgi:hypothetical protein
MSETINWQQVLTELHECMTITALSGKTGVPISTLTDLKAGRSKEPQYAAGHRIYNIYRREKAKQERQKGKEHAA